MLPADQPTRCSRFSQATGWEVMDARIITETNVSLSINGEEWLSFACTPTDLEALGVGFLYNEGLIHQPEEIGAVTLCQQGTNIDVWLRHAVEKPAFWQRTSGCTGGMTTVPRSHNVPSEPIEPFHIEPDALLESMEQLMQTQDLYHEAGGVHCSALFDGKTIRFRAEDIGRHNTLDKLAGLLLLNKTHLRPVMLITTGRISSEMLQKSAQLGAAVVVSRTSPTSLSVAMAREMGLTLVGYARPHRFTVYTYPERVGFDPSSKRIAILNES